MGDAIAAFLVLPQQEAPAFTAKAVRGDDIIKYRLSKNWKNGKYTLLFFYPKGFHFRGSVTF